MSGMEITVAGIEGDGFVGRGDELLALLRHADPELRSAATVRIGQIHGEEAVGLPAEPALMAELARVDAIHPGVADAFWTTFVYDFVMCTPEFGTSQVNAWMLAVLHARKDDRALSPVPGNDLEFYAHEAFDDDPEALMKLLEWGYIDTVEMALGHGELAREPMIALLQAVYARRPRAYLSESLALGYGVLPSSATRRLRSSRRRSGTSCFRSCRALVKSCCGRVGICRWISRWMPRSRWSCCAWFGPEVRACDARSRTDDR